MPFTVRDINENGLAVSCQINAPNAQIVNKFRQIIKTEVPTIAIDAVIIYSNTSTCKDEFLAHRLGLIPLYYQGTGTGKDINSMYLELNVHAINGITNVTTKDFKTSEGISLVSEKVLIAKLYPGESIWLRAYVKEGVGSIHAKWSPITMAVFKEISPNWFEFNMELIGNISAKDLIEQALDILVNPQ